MEAVKQRPYFIWNADLSEEDVRRILAEGSAYSRTQLMGTILQYARFEVFGSTCLCMTCRNTFGKFRGVIQPYAITGSGR